MKRVHFIGSGYESVKWVYVDAKTAGEAIDKAKALYDQNGWDFQYLEMEVDKVEYKTGDTPNPTKPMNGYEFTRFEADFTSKVKAQAYEASVVAEQARQAFEKAGDDYKANPDYEDAKNWFIETTMSCDNDEAINWMKYYMANAIAYGIQTKFLDWRTKFLAAWDLFVSLTGGRYTMSTEQAKFLQSC